MVSATSKRRVVITGLGPISAFGIGIDPLFDALCEGRSAIAPIETFDASGFACSAAAAVAPDAFDVRQIVPKSYRKATKVMARDIELAVGAADEAIRRAGLVTRAHGEGDVTIEPGRFGCHIGAGLIAAEVNELTLAFSASTDAEGEFDIAAWGSGGMSRLTPLWLLKYLPNMLSCHVTIIHDCQGPSNTITCDTASSALSIGESMRVIERGDADACLSGGAESKLHPMGLLRQQFGGRVVELADGEDPTEAARPFSPRARGGVLGEGGGLIVLESLETARARGAAALCELAGFGASHSACTDTVGCRYDEDDESVAHAIEAALRDAGMTADEIDAIVPFGSAIPEMDAIDAAAIRAVFGERAASVPIITLVPNIGHCHAGMSALATCVAAECLRTQRLPARRSADDSAALGVDAGPVDARDADLRAILVFTTSMGGQNAALVLRRLDDDSEASR